MFAKLMLSTSNIDGASSGEVGAVSDHQPDQDNLPAKERDAPNNNDQQSSDEIDGADKTNVE